MGPTLRSCGAVPSVAVALLVGSACDDTTAPTPAHPVVGTYDVRTTLTSHTVVVGCSTQGYCPTVSGPGNAALRGSLVIGNAATYLNGGQLVLLPNVTGQFVTQPCSDQAQCTLTYMADSSSSRVVAPDTVRITLLASGSVPLVALEGRFAGDSIAGTVEWVVRGAREWYDGTFVARRQR